MPDRSSNQVRAEELPTVSPFQVAFVGPPPAQKCPPLVAMVVPFNCILPWSVLEEDIAVLRTKFKDELLEEIIRCLYIPKENTAVWTVAHRLHQAGRIQVHGARDDHDREDHPGQQK